MLLAAWRDDYNREPRAASLANRTPEEFHAHTLVLAAASGSGKSFNPGLSL